MLIKKYKFKKAIFLNCIADYPASIKDFSFYDFDNMKKKHLGDYLIIQLAIKFPQYLY